MYLYGNLSRADEIVVHIILSHERVHYSIYSSCLTRQERSEGGFSRYHGGQTEAGVRRKRTTIKGSLELRKKSFRYLLEAPEAGRLLFRLGFGLCHPHIAFVVHVSVAQYSDKQRTVALTACRQHGIGGWVTCAIN